jgi:hypothetical protein
MQLEYLRDLRVEIDKDIEILETSIEISKTLSLSFIYPPQPSDGTLEEQE